VKEAVVVLGMHRSGTSFLAGSLEALGYRLPRDRQPGAEDNRHGHCEPRAVVALNDAILAAGGGRWDQAAPFRATPAQQAIPDLGARMREALRASFGASRRVVLKDPRLSLTFPLWRDEMAAMGVGLRVLIALRHPVAVAQSLARRNACPPDLAALSWMAHTICAIEASRGLTRAVVAFPDWIAGESGAAEMLAARLGFPADAAADWARASRRAFSAPDLHCRAAEPAGGGLAAAVELYQALRQTGTEDEGLDRAAARFRPALARMQAALAPVDRHRLREIAALSAAPGAQVAADAADRLGAELELAEARIAALRAERDADRMAAAAERARHGRERAGLSARLATLRRLIAVPARSVPPPATVPACGPRSGALSRSWPKRRPLAGPRRSAPTSLTGA
jgi:hypothetical protein